MGAPVRHFPGTPCAWATPAKAKVSPNSSAATRPEPSVMGSSLADDFQYAADYDRSGGASLPSARVGRRHVDEPQLHPLGPVPAIERERAGGMHGAPAALRQREPELLPGHAEGDRVDDRPVAR